VTPADRLDDVWQQLRLHLEWAQGFSLILLFASHPQPVAVLRRRLADSLGLRTRRLQEFVPASPDDLAALAETLLALRPGAAAGPIWAEVWRHASQASWQRARQEFLHRLNERRFVLERDLGWPMVLVLPNDERNRVYIDAPDLWAIRSLTAELPRPAAEAPAERPQAVEDRASAPAGDPMAASEREWARLWQTTPDRSRLDPRDGFAAFDAASERGDFRAARLIAVQTLELARSRVAAAPDWASTRHLAIALANVGDAGEQLGDLAAARAAYGESLELCRQLRASLGDTPQALRDLSISLNKVGGVDAQLGDLEAAHAAYGESLDLRRQLRASLGDTPQALRDLSISLDKVGGVDEQLGDLAAARGAYGESLDLRRQLRASLGDTPQVLRDLSISLNKVAGVDERLGDLEAARGAYGESLELCRQLRASLGDTPQVLRDLSIALDKVGGIEGKDGKSNGTIERV